MAEIHIFIAGMLFGLFVSEVAKIIVNSILFISKKLKEISKKVSK